PGAHIAGGVRLGRGAVVSTGAVILPRITIGSNSVIGAGSVVTESVPDRCLVVGNPGKVVASDYAGYQNMSV
ncbi:MAG: DapH/DapD/GlmU-related protein, partial [Pseudolabrys sp.]